MITKLRIKIVSVMMFVFTILLAIVLIATYVTSKSNLESTCSNNLYSTINYTYSQKAYLPDTTSSPVAVVRVDYLGNIKLLVNHMTSVSNEEICELAREVLSGASSTGELDGNIQFLRRSIGISDIRIAFSDVTVEKEILKKQRINFIAIAIFALAAFFVLSVYISKWIASPVQKSIIAQKQFIADASHELKTPLTVILSNSKMLTGSALTSEADKVRINNIIEESEQMKLLIEDMLQIARFDSALLPSKHETVSFSDIIMASVVTYEPYAYDNHRELCSDIAPDISLSGNPTKLKQLIDILLDNALKYSLEHSSIHVSLTQEGKKALLYVESLGSPISDEDAARIFEKFYRTDKSREETNGYGLGLSIAKMIVDEHRGHIWVVSSEQGCNRFYVQLPL